MIQHTLVPKSLESREQEAIEFLKERGYKVVKLRTVGKAPTNQQLVEHFYNRLRELGGTEELLVGRRLNEDLDLKAVTRFQTKAKKEGLSKTAANQTLLDMINLVFDYFDQIPSIKNPPYSLNFLVSKKGSWIINKSIIAQKEAMESYESSEDAVEYKRKLYNDMEEDHKFIELKEKRHRELLKKEDS